VSAIDAPTLKVGPPARPRAAVRRPSPAGQPTGSLYWQTVLRVGLAGNPVQPLINGADSVAAIQRAMPSTEESRCTR
jgi:hypothetical protein